MQRCTGSYLPSRRLNKEVPDVNSYLTDRREIWNTILGPDPGVGYTPLPFFYSRSNKHEKLKLLSAQPFMQKV